MNRIVQIRRPITPALVFLLVWLTVPVAQASQDIDDIRFPEENWSQDLLSLLDYGPFFLDRDFEIAIDPPQKNSSKAVIDELDYLRGLVSRRTPEQIEKIEFEKTKGLPAQFMAAGLINKASHSKTVKLLMRVDQDMRYFTIREKKRFQRPRPSQLAGDLTLVIENPPHAAYPSGHAGQSFAGALVLSMLDPDHEDDYKQLARDIAWRRELAGVHYPSDSAAGRELAKQVVEALRENERFQEMFAAAKEEFGN